MYRILVLASAVFYYGTGVTASGGSGGSGGPASLFDAYDLVKELVGQGSFFLGSRRCSDVQYTFPQVLQLYSLLLC